MRIQEVIKQTALSKKAIRYYIDEQLLSPAAAENGYLDFSEADVRRLNLIHRLRTVDMPVSDIKSFLKDPQTALFTLIKHKKELRRRRAVLDYQTSMTDQLIADTDFEQMMHRLGEPMPKDLPAMLEDREAKVIGDDDVEMVIYSLKANFLHNLEMTEYRRFLLDRLKKYIIANQTPDMITIRDYWYSQTSQYIANKMPPSIKIIEEIAAVRESDFEAFFERMLVLIRRHLEDPAWVHSWHKYYDAWLHPSGAFYNDKIFDLMQEISPLYAHCAANLARFDARFRAYLQTDGGALLLNEISQKLREHFDLERRESGDITCLLFEM